MLNIQEKVGYFKFENEYKSKYKSNKYLEDSPSSSNMILRIH